MHYQSSKGPHQAGRPWAMWLVLCVLVLGALAPTVSRALVWSTSEPLQEICTAGGGAIWVSALPDATEGGASDGQSPLPSLDHCLLCLQAAERSAAPLPHQPYLFLALGGTTARPHRQAFFLFSNIQRTPPARGPPAQA
ncbi:MAG: DUF2946 domain-containing protein [Rhodoferax sp.]|uniref:DUF2946 domain-containing protein n=1 Tax=Rhodoferax sp. TaxID=50421 RepID=UPI002ACEAAF4|nr:DUF2946 domain-containing protein [Rhodoferax sp.]MDZ7890288.1 DUF2946 domain-containing protein [Rhodoferax sp.]